MGVRRLQDAVLAHLDSVGKPPLMGVRNTRVGMGPAVAVYPRGARGAPGQCAMQRMAAKIVMA